MFMQYLLAKILIVICLSIRPRANVSRSIESSLCLGRLCFLSTLLCRLLLLHLLIAQRRQSTGNLLDLLARQIFGNLLGELLQEQRVLALLGIVANKRHERIAQLGELVLGIRVENVQRAQVDGLGRVALVSQCDGLGSFFVVSDSTKEILSLCARAIDFLLSQPNAALLLSLVLVAAQIAGLAP